jgi:hypothetical protein
MKLAKQIFLVLIEVVTCTYLLSSISIEFIPPASTWEYVERYVFCYGVYQFIIYLILSNANDSRKDMYLALLTSYRLAESYLNTLDDRILVYLNEKIKRQLNKTMFNDVDIKKEYSILDKLIAYKDIHMIQHKIITYEHLLEYTSLLWRYNFLLRLMK